MYNAQDDPVVRQVMIWTEEATARQRIEFEELTVDRLEKVYEKGLGKAVGVHEAALESQDEKLRYDAALRWVDRAAGKTLQKSINLHAGKIIHTHEIPQQVIQLVDGAAMEVASLALPAADVVVEGELVESPDGSD